MRYGMLHKFTRYSPTFFKPNLLNIVKFTSINMSMDPKVLEESKLMLKDMYFAGVKAVSPKQLIIDKVKYKDGILQVCDQQIQLRENVYLVGFGKAVMGMSVVLEHMLADCLKKGIVSIPSASTNEMWETKDKTYFPKLKTSVVEYCEGGMDNQPDHRSLNTSHDIIDLVESLTENDTLIVLISGGGSALLYMPRPIIDHEDKLLLCKNLQNAGADIKEVNTIRMKLSMVKGGGLARMTYPANIVTLILSDIVGDPIDLIASGPTVYNAKVPKQSIAILKKYKLFDKLEVDVKKAIISKETFKDKPLLTGKRKKKKEFKHVVNIILGNNQVAVEAAALEAQRQKLTPIILRTDITGNVHDVSLAYVHVTSLICLALEKKLERAKFFERVRDIPVLSLPTTKVDEIYNLIEDGCGEGIVLIGGGEPTVIVKGDGKGGRNQELALHFSLDCLAEIKSNPHFAEYDVIMLSAGTDGQDGPTDAAGAFGYPAIGPIIHDLHAKVKMFTSKMLVHLQMKKEAMKKKEEEQKRLEKLKPDICKLHELSGFVVKKKDELKPNESENIMKEEEIGTEKIDEMEDVLPLIYQTMEVERMLPENALSQNNSYNLYSRFKKGSELFKTGFTGTNVMDLHFIYIKKRKCDCSIDSVLFGKGKTENNFEDHDFHIDFSTIERYKFLQGRKAFDWGSYLRTSSLVPSEEVEHPNIKIIDDNLTDPCCRRDRKFPLKYLLKDKNLPL